MKLLLMNPGSPRRRRHVFRNGSARRARKNPSAKEAKLRSKARSWSTAFAKKLGLTPAQTRKILMREGVIDGRLLRKVRPGLSKAKLKSVGKSVTAEMGTTWFGKKTTQTKASTSMARRRRAKARKTPKRRSRRAKVRLNPRRKRRAKIRLNPRRKRRAKKAKVTVRRRRRRARKSAGTTVRRRRRRAAVALPKPRRRRRRAGKRKAGYSKGQRRHRRALHAGMVTPKQVAALVKTGARIAKSSAGTPLAKAARRWNRKRKSTRGMRTIARAWQHAKKAQRLARSPKEAAYLRATGLAGVPNPGFGALKGVVALLPAAGVGLTSAVGLAWLGQTAGDKLEGALVGKVPTIISSAAVPVTTLGLAVAAYLGSRNVKPLARFSLPILLGGIFAAGLHVLARVKVAGPAALPDPSKPAGEGNQPVATMISIGRKIGLPIGEYTMVGSAGIFGEYTSTGEYVSTAGMDDDSPYDSLRGEDDDPDFADGESPDDTDGSLSGGIFD